MKRGVFKCVPMFVVLVVLHVTLPTLVAFPVNVRAPNMYGIFRTPIRCSSKGKYSNHNQTTRLSKQLIEKTHN